MDNNSQLQLPHELPNQRFYFSFNSLSFEMMDDEKTREIFLNTRTTIYSYYVESLALLRSTRRFFNLVYSEEQQLEKEYNDYKAMFDDVSYEEEEDFSFAFSRFNDRQLERYEDLDLEKNQTALGTIVQFLSLLESTLHSLYIKIINFDQRLPTIDTVCKREKGILKYLKYFEKTLITNEDPILIGTTNYQKIYLWIKIRNNIVHNNNEMNEELQQAIMVQNLQINSWRNKFQFTESDIDDLSDICGIILDVLIEEVLRTFFINNK